MKKTQYNEPTLYLLSSVNNYQLMANLACILNTFPNLDYFETNT